VVALEIAGQSFAVNFPGTQSEAQESSKNLLRKSDLVMTSGQETYHKGRVITE
jgi:hypothetical protein